MTMPTPKYDPDERFTLEHDPDDVLRRLLDGEEEPTRDDKRDEENSSRSR